MELNKEQKEIIGYGVAKTVKAMAGAGTGKTRVLVERYLKFVFDDGIPPERLLALTFTKKAASEMRERIFETARKRGDDALMRELYTAWIMNFHQFAFRLISDNASGFRIDPDVGVVSDVDAARIRTALYRRFQSGNIDGFTFGAGEDVPPPAKIPGMFKRWMQILQRARATLWAPEDLMACVGDTDEPDYARYVGSVAALWYAYEDELRRRNLIDFNDMIGLVVRGLREDEGLRSLFGDRFQHILVDEFQDTSEAQNELLRALAGDDFSRVTVVGDDKQSIYRWRDARVENLREFDGLQKELRINYRSRQNILDLAHHFVIRDDYFGKHADKIRLDADRDATDVPVCLFHPEDEDGKSFEEEAKGLVSWVLALTGRIGGDVSPCPYRGARGDGEFLRFDDIAILMRSLKASSGLPQFEKALRTAGIPYAVCGGVGSLEVRVLQLFKYLLRLLVHADDVHAVVGLLEARPYSVPDSALVELFDGVEHPVDVLSLLSDGGVARLSDTHAKDACRRLRELIVTLAQRRERVDFPSFVVDALELSQFYFRFFDDGADTAVVESVTKTVIGLVEELVGRGEGNLSALLEALDLLLSKKSFDDSRGPLFPPGRVKILTIHSAKGLEFPAVAIPGIKKGKNTKGEFLLSRGKGLFVNDAKEWGRGVDDSGEVDKARSEKEQEERCLLYVAITRARDHLFLSSPFPCGMQNKTPNLFADILDVVREEDIHYVELRRAPEIEMDSIPAPAKPDCFEGDVQPLLERWSAGRTRLSSAARVAPVPVRGVEFVTWSALHDFSSCPLAFKYRHLLGVNAEITADSDGSSPPGIGAHGRSDALALGTLLHDYLCEYMASGQAGDRPIAAGLIEFAGRYGGDEAKRRNLAKRAAERLNEFAKSPLADPSCVKWTEQPVRARLDRLVFRAVLDRVDLVGGERRIIDYKLETEHDKHHYQIQFYTWLLRTRSSMVVKDAALCYLQKPTKIVPVDVTSDAIAAIDRDARALSDAVATGCFDPRENPPCGACRFSSLCPAARLETPVD